MSHFNSINAISPIDGRYYSYTSVLSPYFSEFGLIKYRVRVEIEYFIALCELPLPELSSFKKSNYSQLRDLYLNFSEDHALAIKKIEKTINHDVKSVEYFIKESFDKLGLKQFKEFIHFGLTSQDINNTAIPLSLKEGMITSIKPLLNEVKNAIHTLGTQWVNIPMLAKTHGQPATPTLLGKEIAVFYARLEQQLLSLESIPYAAKFGGATGNMNAHYVTYPSVDWFRFTNHFVEKVLGLQRSYPTTQIEHYDQMAAFFDNLKRINTIFIDFSRDVWQYISQQYFKQEINKDEVGSSAMPHKVNPIDFENAEGNLGIANALFEHLSANLPVSRLQRDLTDSTVLRNIGVPISHMVIALNSLLKGIKKLALNKLVIDSDLEDNWAVVAEAIQNILRREGFPNPYETLKKLTRRDEKITQKSISIFIDKLDIAACVKEELKAISPHNYVGKF